MTVHILNGDALRQQFPDTIVGEKIIMRECLMDGPVDAPTFDSFLKQRAAFISTLQEDLTESFYYEQTATQLEAIKNLPSGAEVYLWFEDDLFCQVNMWFVVNQLVTSGKPYSVFLIRPPLNTPFSFGELDATGLEKCFNKKIPLSSIESISELWTAFIANDLELLSEMGVKIKPKYPFISEAIQAHLERQPKGSYIGRPIQSLKQIIDELQTTDFDLVFKEFNRRESIYGYGDLQVKYLLDQLIQN